MQQLPFSQFTADTFERIFGAYVIANKSHWQTPPFQMVSQRILEQGFYAYTAGQPDNWSTKLRFEHANNIVYVQVVINPELPKSMQGFAEKIKDEALERIEIIVNSIQEV